MVKRLKAIRINEKDLAELKKIARKRGETVSFLIQQAIREYLERRAAKDEHPVEGQDEEAS